MKLPDEKLYASASEPTTLPETLTRSSTDTGRGPPRDVVVPCQLLHVNGVPLEAVLTAADPERPAHARDGAMCSCCSFTRVPADGSGFAMCTATCKGTVAAVHVSMQRVTVATRTSRPCETPACSRSGSRCTPTAAAAPAAAAFQSRRCRSPLNAVGMLARRCPKFPSPVGEPFHM